MDMIRSGSVGKQLASKRQQQINVCSGASIVPERYLVSIQSSSSHVLIQLQDDPLRPLVFIAHCFDGLVILKVRHIRPIIGGVLTVLGYRGREAV